MSATRADAYAGFDRFVTIYAVKYPNGPRKIVIASCAATRRPTSVYCVLTLASPAVPMLGERLPDKARDMKAANPAWARQT
jgi:hypothetical protein